MATPHVAGGAALLAQQHPDWTGAQLKTALTGAAHELPGVGPASVGAGRLDLARVTTQQVHASTTSLNAFFPYTTGAPAPKRFPVTYRNTGTTPVELTFDVGALPAALVELSANTLAVPAGGVATVTVTVTGRFDRSGSQFGVLTATAAGGVRLRTPIGATQEPESYHLTIRALDRAGSAPHGLGFGTATVINADTGARTYAGDGDRLWLPVGRYTVLGAIGTPRDGQSPTLSLVDQPNLRLGSDTTLTLDARTAKRVSLQPDQPAAWGGSLTVSRQVIPANGSTGLSAIWFAEQLDEMYAVSAPGARSDGYTFAAFRTAVEPAIDLTAESPERFPVFAEWIVESPKPDLSGRIGVVNAGLGTPADLAKVDAKGKLVLITLSDSVDLLQAVRDVAAAGGKAVIGLMASQEPAPAMARMTEETEIALPLLWTAGPSGDRFAALAAKPGAMARLTTNSRPKHRYELVLPSRGSMPTVLERRYATKDLAAVRARYYSTGADQRLRAPTFWFGGSGFGPMLYSRLTVPAERTEYFSPGQWTLDSTPQGYDGSGLRSDVLTLRAGQRTSLDWNKPVYAPSFAHGKTGYLRGQHWVQRTAGSIDVELPLYADADGNSRGPGGPDDEGTLRLYRDGDLVGSSDNAGYGSFQIPAERAAYKLTANNRRTASWWPLATSTSAEWTFASAAATGEPTALPLLYFGFDPKVDLTGKAPGGRAFTFPVTVGRQAGSGTPTVRSLAVQVSYDDGATWRPATVTRSGTKWTVGVTHPASGFVSLRAQTADTGGNTAALTVVRAYALR